MSSWIQTVSGLAFDFDTVEENVIRIEDIAHALSHVNRFTGHTEPAYNVAHHSVLVSRVVQGYAREWCMDERALAMRGLLHDAAEAYVGDVSRPLKSLLPEYVAIERRVEALIERTFGLCEDPLGLVKKADLALCATEARDLMAPYARPWNLNVRAIPQAQMRPIVPMPPKASRRAFVMRYIELGGERPRGFVPPRKWEE